MLEELNRATSVRAAAATLASEFDQPVDVVTRDVYEFCTGLFSRGLLVVQPSPE